MELLADDLGKIHRGGLNVFIFNEIDVHVTAKGFIPWFKFLFVGGMTKWHAGRVDRPVLSCPCLWLEVGTRGNKLCPSLGAACGRKLGMTEERVAHSAKHSGLPSSMTSTHATCRVCKCGTNRMGAVYPPKSKLAYAGPVILRRSV